jgi:hypothetical protein
LSVKIVSFFTILPPLMAISRAIHILISSAPSHMLCGVSEVL